jgi:hypothetical protein
MDAARVSINKVCLPGNAKASSASRNTITICRLQAGAIQCRKLSLIEA